MKQTIGNFIKYIHLITVFFILFINGILAPVAFGAEVVFIANSSIGDSSLTKAGIKEIYLGKQIKWTDGSKIKLGSLKKCDLHDQFTKDFLSKSPSQFRMYWKKMVFTGKGKAPKACASEAAMINYIKATEGAFGYISSGISPEGVKTIKISDN